MNLPQIVDEWRDEEGCGLKLGGQNCTKIVNVQESEFLIIVVKRMVNYGDGPKILRNNIPLGGDVEVEDLLSQTAHYRPLAVIFHIGEVEGSTAYGHYKADIRNTNGKWYRTSDDMVPQQITEDEISEQGYIYLYQRMATS